MARKKEPDLEIKNRDRIVEVTKKLFLSNGIEETTMNDIAREVGMSKSTLYVYFKNKDEVKNYLSMEAMEYLYQQLTSSLTTTKMSAHDQFMKICDILVEFYDQYPINFDMLVREICVEKDIIDHDPILKKTYETGEAINHFLFTTLGSRIKSSDPKELFLFVIGSWGKIYGIILLAQQKEKYILQQTGVNKEEFMKRNFEDLYQSVQWRD